jgi:hypothetical protein
MKTGLQRRLYIGLLHYPVYNKHAQRIAAAVSTVDLHDLARLGRTYNVKGFFVITPLEDQQRLTQKVIKHWTRGYGATYNPLRKEAVELIRLCGSLEDCLAGIQEAEGERPLLIVTDASRWPDRNLHYGQAADLIDSGKPVLLIFGTAWGLDREVLNEADYILDPIEGGSDYNHLSVRAAAAIILDRVSGSPGLNRP